MFKSIDVGLKGIAWSPKGYLLTIHNSNGELFKIDLKQGGEVSKVITKTFFPGGDGLLLDSAENLVLIQNKGVHKIYEIRSNNNWKADEINAYSLLVDRFHQLTTGTMNGNKL